MSCSSSFDEQDHTLNVAENLLTTLTSVNQKFVRGRSTLPARIYRVGVSIIAPAIAYLTRRALIANPITWVRIFFLLVKRTSRSAFAAAFTDASCRRLNGTELK